MSVCRGTTVCAALGTGACAWGCNADASYCSTRHADCDATVETGTRPAHPGPRAHNVLFIFTEDQGLQLSLVGTPGLKTPNMDALAQEGAFYRNAWTTLATCTGSKSAVFTGLHNHNSGALGNVNEFIGSAEELATVNPSWYSQPDSAYHNYQICEDVPTLIELLREQGHYTGLQNKFHLSPHSKFPYDQWLKPANAGDVLDFIETAQDLHRDWFLVHVIADPHRPYPDSIADGIEVDLDAVAPPGHLPDTEVVQRDWAEYLAAIEDADNKVGQVLQALEDSGQAEQTLVVLMGDHGPAYHRGKWTAYDLGLRVPLMLRGPGITAGTRTEVLSAVDLMPTMLDFLGMDVPRRTDGVSHYPLLTGAASKPLRRYAVGVSESDRSITDGHFRLMFMPKASDTKVPSDNSDPVPWGNLVYEHVRDNANTAGFEDAYRFLDLADASLREYERPRFELFDLHNDPWELHDLAPSPNHEEQFEELRDALVEWMGRTADPGESP